MKKQLKSLLGLLLALAMCLPLVACGGETKDPAKPDNVDKPNNVESPDDSTDAPEGGEPAEGGLIEGFLDSIEGLPETLENNEISIVYWYNQNQYEYDVSKNPNVYDPILEAIPYFEEKYGGKVNYTYADWNDMLETVIAQQKAGSAPDLFEVYDSNMYSVVLSGVAQPLTNYVSDADYSFYDVEKSLFSWKGEPYAIPLKPYVRLIMFNRDLFDLEGIDAPDVLFQNGEWNWETFRTVCKSMYKQQNGVTLQSSYGGWQESMLYFMYANGSSMLKIDTETGTVVPNLEDEKAKSAINLLVEVRDTLNWNNALDYFDQGIEAMVCGKEFDASILTLPFEVGVVPFPYGDDFEGRNVVVYPQGMAVPTGAKNPEGAVAFMRIVNELQKVLGDKREAARIGQANYDMIYADDVKFVYAYDKCLPDADRLIATMTNYITDGVPAATSVANVLPDLISQIEKMYGQQ